MGEDTEEPGEDPEIWKPALLLLRCADEGAFSGGPDHLRRIIGLYPGGLWLAHMFSRFGLDEADMAGALAIWLRGLAAVRQFGAFQSLLELAQGERHGWIAYRAPTGRMVRRLDPARGIFIGRGVGMPLLRVMAPGTFRRFRSGPFSQAGRAMFVAVTDDGHYTPRISLSRYVLGRLHGAEPGRPALLAASGRDVTIRWYTHGTAARCRTDGFCPGSSP